MQDEHDLKRQHNMSNSAARPHDQSTTMHGVRTSMCYKKPSLVFADIPTHIGSGFAQSPDNRIARMSQHGQKAYRTSCAPVAGELLKPLILTLTDGAPGCRRARPR